MCRDEIGSNHLVTRHNELDEILNKTSQYIQPFHTTERQFPLKKTNPSWYTSKTASYSYTLDFTGGANDDG